MPMRDDLDIHKPVPGPLIKAVTSWDKRQPSEATLATIKGEILAKLMLSVGKDPSSVTERDWFLAAALTARDRVVHRWIASERESHARGRKRVYYLSLEFLIGRLLFDVLENLGLYETFHTAFGDLGVDLARLRRAEPDAALGNGGLGRLAACFMESMATLGIPAYGYGIRYDHGLFRQVITDGWQQEYPEEWLSFGNPWEFARPEVIYDIQFGGWVEHMAGKNGEHRSTWHSQETIEAVAYDTPIVGWRGKRINPLRLWSARAVDPMRLDVFNRGDHAAASSAQVRAEAISKVLYPSDESAAGQDLRLRQEYFFVSASLQDLIARHIHSYGDIHFPAGSRRDPTQRYPSQPGRSRVHAASGRYPQVPLARGLGAHERDPVLYQPHAAARGARKLAGRANGAGPAAPPGDHLPDQ
jgi:starch phosphorylase